MATFKPQYKDKNGVVKDLNIDYNSLANQPTIGQGTLTIQKNGSNVATFGANSTSNVTANITVPTTLDDINDGSTRKLANYLPLSGGTMTGNISYKGTQATYSMIRWIDNTADTYGNGIRIGGGGATIIGGGESADLPSVSGGDEILYLMNDGNIDFYSNCQDGLGSAKHMSFDTSGNLNVPYVRASGNIYEGGTLLSNKYASASHNHDNTYLGKTTYEWNKEFAAGSNGAVSLGRYNLYDTQLTFDITTTTSTTLSGKLVIASQNGNIRKATVYGDASNTLVNYLTIYQSAITNSRSWVEIFCNFPAWSKNKVHIYGVSLNSATVTRQMTSVTFTNGVPSGVTSGDTKWTGTIVNDITTYCATKNHNHDSSYLGKTATAANSSKLNNQEASYYATAAAVTTNANNIATNTSNIATNTSKINKIINGGQAVNSAVYDEQGNKINTTYATKSSVTLVSDNLDLLERELGDGSFVVEAARCDGDGKTISTTYATKDEATAGSKKTSSANSTSKLFLIGATSQSADASTTYSNSKCYVGTDNCLYSNSTKVLTAHSYRPIQVNGTSILANTSSTALNLKAGTNISLSNSNGTVTINSTASGGGGVASSKIFEGAGDTSGYYTTTLTSGNYKMLLFEINVSDYDFYLVVPTDYIKTASQSFHFVVGSVYNGGLGIVEVTASNTNFSASVSSGNIVVYNANVYAYK